MNDPEAAYLNALTQCSERYWNMCRVGQDDELLKFVQEFRTALSLCEAHMMAGPNYNDLPPRPSLNKLNRWLGYIQGVLIERGRTTVQIERDWTRPLFKPLDYPEQFDQD